MFAKQVVVKDMRLFANLTVSSLFLFQELMNDCNAVHPGASNRLRTEVIQCGVCVTTFACVLLQWFFFSCHLSAFVRDIFVLRWRPRI